MKDVLSRIGIGSARVDTVLPSSTVRAGDAVDAEVHVEGGSTDQDIDAIYFALETEYRTEEGYADAIVDKWQLTEPFTIGSGEERRFETTIDVPRRTPVTVGSVSVEIETGLDISMAVDPEDEDRIEVRPTERLQAVFDALENVGFSMKSSSCEARPGGIFSTSASFVQEFEFRPQRGEFSGEVDEVEIIPVYDGNGLTVHMEVDRRGGLLSEAMDIDERHTSFTVQDADPAAIEPSLTQAIRDLS
ncbi:sporulation protein [Halomicroarcula sp. S1AR25-4]|uniref:sporulation protein n=1 Tax=Haloarcula sp. S1AR25-4 TaxID=2950538 RepID=UPI002876C317|nr:sporulation protein [Halomicroarcula sp. S1AR25-4]MDS0276206.1 sporulation protein [Halomicroarcula sp. S1AR25-4]